MKLLWISPFAPYDLVGHGGGQNHNYYVKYIKKNTDFDLTLVTVCEKKEKDKIDLEKYNIEHILKVYDKDEFKSKLYRLFGLLYIFRDGSLLNSAIKRLLIKAIDEYAIKNEQPDVIITQWTEASLLIEYIKEKFPESKCIAIEEDVAFLGYKRKYEDARGAYRLYRKLKYIKLKKAEITALKKFECVVALNQKDKNLLEKQGINSKKILQMCSYHGFYNDLIYSPNEYQLLFYGAMSRRENYESVMWIIENVMPKLDERYQLYVVGSNPNENLKRYESDRIHITGFVDKVNPYFEKSLCLISPLLLGAGIKIKVLEAMSAGLPVLTNDIGAEGIGLTDSFNYMHCDTAEEYVNAINLLTKDCQLRERLSVNGKKHIEHYFNADVALDRFIERIYKL